MPRINQLAHIFGDNVRKSREQMNISQEELADRASLHRTYIGMVERAERSISLVNAKRIADALGTDLNTLTSSHDKE